MLVNPLVDEDGRVILPSTGDGTTDGGKQPGKDAGAHDERHSDGEEGTGDASGGGAADADTPGPVPHSIHLADTGSGTRLSALLTSPFDQLASPSLHAAAHTHHLQHAAQPDSPATPLTADAAPTSPTTRTTPTLVGERCSTSGTASQPVSTGVGSGKSLLVHLGSINPNNWLPLLAFRKRLIEGEVAPESSTASVASTEERNETTTARGIRNTACRPISAAKKQQILDLEPTGMSARAIARQVGTSTSTVKAVCRQAKQPLRRKRRFTSDDLQRAQQLHAQGRTYIEIGLELGFGRDTVSKHLAATQA